MCVTCFTPQPNKALCNDIHSVMWCRWGGACKYPHHHKQVQVWVVDSVNHFWFIYRLVTIFPWQTLNTSTVHDSLHLQQLICTFAIVCRQIELPNHALVIAPAILHTIDPTSVDRCSAWLWQKFKRGSTVSFKLVTLLWHFAYRDSVMRLTGWRMGLVYIELRAAGIYVSYRNWVWLRNCELIMAVCSIEVSGWLVTFCKSTKEYEEEDNFMQAFINNSLLTLSPDLQGCGILWIVRNFKKIIEYQMAGSVCLRP